MDKNNNLTKTSGNMQIEFSEITDMSDVNFKEAIKIYSKSFPSNERHSTDVIEKRMRGNLYRMIIGRLKNEIVLMALFWTLKNTDFILFDYMAVKKSHQNKGIGTIFMKNIFDILGIKDKYLVLEVEDPNYGDNKEQRKRRVNFYKRHGAKEMKDVRYILPPLSGNTPTEMILMILPQYDNGNISGKIVKKIIIQIYKELYNRNEDDALLNTFIHQIPSIVELKGE